MSRENIETSLPTGWSGGTYHNPKIQTYQNLANRIKILMGSTLEISDTHIATAIDKSIEKYSRYAGYEDQYVVFCDENIDSSCEVKLDDLVLGCMCNDVYNQDGSYETTVVTSTNIEQTLLGSGSALVSAYTYTSSQESLTSNINQNTPSVCVNELDVFFDPANPWDFEVCEADMVDIKPLDTYPETKECSPCMDAWLNIKDGKGCFYPRNYQDLDKCSPTTSWWGLDQWQTTSFCPEESTHVLIKDVPSCTVEGLNCLSINNKGRAGEIIVENKALDTCGDIEVKIQFVSDYQLPEELVGNYDVVKNNGFKLELKPKEEFSCTQYKVPVNADFYTTTTSFEYGTTSIPPNNLFDDNSLGCPRKIVDVFSVQPTGGNKNRSYGMGSGHNVLFNFNYDISNNSLGYGLSNRGYDLVGWEMLNQFLETSDTLFGNNPQTGYTFNPKTQKLRVIGSSSTKNYCCDSTQKCCYVLGVKLEASIEQMLGEIWVQDYALALTKIMQGNALSKFSGAVVLDGITINTSDILAQGLEEKQKLEEDLIKNKTESTQGSAFLIC